MENIKEGTDENKLFADQNTRTIIIEYKGENWTFEVRELSWKQKGDCVTAGTKVNINKGRNGAEKSITMDMMAYNIAYLLKAVVKSPFKTFNMATFIKLGDEFGTLMVNAIIDSGAQTDDEEKNSEIMSEV